MAEQSLAIQITRSGSQPAVAGAASSFTGAAEIQPLFPAHDASRVIGGSVTFQPGARTAWHTHPLGQILIVTEGAGWIQQWNGPVQDIRKGDVIWIPPNTKHWHGATASTSMTHIAIQEEQNGKVIEWLEKVTDDQYLKR
jgi:quercetin dioxygenase-like cupin family protein